MDTEEVVIMSQRLSEDIKERIRRFNNETGGQFHINVDYLVHHEIGRRPQYEVTVSSSVVFRS